MTQAAAAPAPPPPLVHREAKWIPTLVVFLVVVAVVLGGVLAAGAVGPAGPRVGPAQLGDQPIDVGFGVVFTPAVGWEVVRPAAETQPGSGISRVTLSRSPGAMDVYAVPGATDPQALLNDYVENALRPAATQLQLSTVELVELPGGPGARVVYLGTFEGVNVPLEGEVITVGGSQTGAVIDALAPEGAYLGVIDAVHLMAQTVRVP